jgi:hypothetical protein
MTAARQPSAEDRLAAIRIALAGIARGTELGDIGVRLERLHPRNNTFPGEVLLELAADDLWWWGLPALVVYVRVAARTGEPVADVSGRLARRDGVDLTASVS